MKRIINFIKKEYFLILIFIIFSTIPFMRLLFGYSVIQNSISFFTKNYHYFSNSLYTWDSQIFGTSSPASPWQLFPLGFIFYLFNSVIGMNVNITQFLILFTLFLIGFISFFILIKNLFKSEKINNIAIFVGSLFFIFNLYVITSLAGSFHLIMPYVFLPLQFYLFIRGLNNNQLVKYAIFISLISLLIFGINLVFDVIIFFLLISYGLWTVFVLKKVDFKRFVKFVSLFSFFTLLIISWWLIPFIYSNLINSEGVGYVLSSEKFYNVDSSATNVLRNLGDWGFFSGRISGRISGQESIPYLEFSPSYKSNFLIVFITFFIPLIVFCALFLVHRIREKVVRKKLLFFYLLLIILLPFIGGTYKTWPTANLMQWCFDNVPFFSIFRNTYKWTSLVTFCYAIILTLFINFIINFKTNNLYKKLLLKYFLPCLFIIIIAISAFPLLTNKVFDGKIRIREIPKYWYDASAYINNNLNQDKDRILLLPNQYFPVFLWNNEIKSMPSDMTSALFKVPSVSNVPKGSGQIYSAELINFIYSNIGEENIDKFLGLLNISHILQRNDYYSDYYNVEKPEAIKKILSDYHSLSFLKSFGMIDIYQIKDDLVYPRIYTSQNIIYSDGSIENLADIVNFGDWKIRSGVYLSGIADNTDRNTEKTDEARRTLMGRADEIFVKGKLENVINEEEFEVSYPEVFFPYVRQKPGSLFYPLVLKKEEYDKWKARKEPEKLFEKNLFYASKRVSEIIAFGVNELVLANYKEEMTNALGILKKLKQEGSKDFVKLLAKYEGTLWGQREKIKGIGNLIDWDNAFKELDGQADGLKIKRDFLKLAYKVEIPRAGEYEIFINENGEEKNLGKKYFEKGIQELVLPIKGISENLISKNLQVKNYISNSIYEISFDYQAFDKAKFFIKENNNEEIAKTNLFSTGKEFEHFEMYFKSSPEATSAAVRFSDLKENNETDSKVRYKNLQVQQILQPNLILKSIKPQTSNSKPQMPKITFVKINPTKYRIKVEGAKEPYTLVFSESFHQGWKAYVNGEIKEGTYENIFLDRNTFEIWGRKPIPEDKHLLVNGYANSWYISPEDAQGQENYEIIIEFLPQRYFYIGLFTSILTLVGCLGYLVFNRFSKIFRKK